MKKPNLALIAGILFGVVVFSFLANWFLQKSLSNLPIKTITEDKLSSLLGAKVSIGELKFGLTKQISLSGIKIDADGTQDMGFFLASARAISYRYNFLNLISRNFKAPHKVILDSPKLLLKSFQFPSTLFTKKKEVNELTPDFLGQKFELAVKNGVAEYPLFEGYKIGLSGVTGSFRPNEKGAMKVHLRAKGTGILRGNFAIDGIVAPLKKNYSINFKFREGGEVLLPGFLRARHIAGNFRLEPNRLIIDRLRFSVADLVFEGKGEILDFESGLPTISLSFKLLSQKTPPSLELVLDFKKEIISGKVETREGAFPFTGDLFREDESIRIADVKISGGYALSGDFNIQQNVYQVSFDRGEMRANINFSFDDWDTMIYANLEHFDLYGFDLVTFIRLRLKPAEEFIAEKKWAFLGELKTDYLIVDTLPLNDFEGGFRLDHLHFKDIQLSWGKEYALTGDYDLTSPREARFHLDLQSVDLGNLRRIFLYSRPQELGGRAQGGIDITGDLKNPQISGGVIVTNGVIGKLNFKNADLKFSGYYPYLRLNDSEITRGRGKLYLEGDLNLKASNIFQDLKVVSQDHIVVWRGLILNESLQDNLVMIGEGLKRKLTEK